MAAVERREGTGAGAVARSSGKGEATGGGAKGTAWIQSCVQIRIEYANLSLNLCGVCPPSLGRGRSQEAGVTGEQATQGLRRRREATEVGSGSSGGGGGTAGTAGVGAGVGAAVGVKAEESGGG